MTSWIVAAIMLPLVAPSAVASRSLFHASQADTTCLVARAQAFRDLLQAEDYDAAERMLTADPRRWWGVREGEDADDSTPWIPGDGLLQGAALEIGAGRVAVFGGMSWDG